MKYLFIWISLFVVMLVYDSGFAENPSVLEWHVQQQTDYLSVVNDWFEKRNLPGYYVIHEIVLTEDGVMVNVSAVWIKDESQTQRAQLEDVQLLISHTGELYGVQSLHKDSVECHPEQAV